MTASPITWTTRRPESPWTIPAGSLLLASSARREDWLAVRKTLIGGSDIAKIVGVSHYGDAFTVWADKTGRAPVEVASNAMERGRILEDGVIDLWVTRYVDFPIEVRRQGLLRSRRCPHAGATVDRISICEIGRCLVEVKTQSDLREWGTDAEPEIPVGFQFQGQWQLGVTGRDHVHFVVLGPRLVPVHRLMHRDDVLIDRLFTIVEKWWPEHVEADVAPSASSRSSAMVKSMFGNPTPGAAYVLDAEDAELFRALPLLKADLEAAQTAYDDTLAQLQAKIGDATEVFYDPPTGIASKPVATWRATKTIDGATKEFAAAHRNLVEPFMKTVEKREMDVDKLIENHPELLASGVLRHRRSWLIK
jgi:putative phage-type endonuclease